MNHSSAEADKPQRGRLQQSYPFDYKTINEDFSLPLQNSCLVWMKQVNQVDNFFKKKMEELRSLINLNDNPPESRRNHMVQLRLTMRQMKLAMEEKSVRNERFIDCVSNIANVSATAAEAEKSAASVSVPKMKKLHNKLAELRKLKADKRLAKLKGKKGADEVVENNETTVEIVQAGVDSKVAQIAFPSVALFPPTVDERIKTDFKSTENFVSIKRRFTQTKLADCLEPKRIKVEVHWAEPEISVLKPSPKLVEIDNLMIGEPSNPVEETQPNPQVDNRAEECAYPIMPPATPKKPVEVDIELLQEPVEKVVKLESENFSKLSNTSKSDQLLPKIIEHQETILDTFETTEEMPITREPTPVFKEVTPVPAEMPESKVKPKKVEKVVKIAPELTLTLKKTAKLPPKKTDKKVKKIVKPRRPITRLSKKAALIARPMRKILTRTATRKPYGKAVLSIEEIAVQKAERARRKVQRLVQRRQEEADAAEVAMVEAQLAAEGEIPSRRAAATAAAAAIHSTQSPRSSFAISNPQTALAMTSPKPFELSQKTSTLAHGKNSGLEREVPNDPTTTLNSIQTSFQSPFTGTIQTRSRRNIVSQTPIVVDTNIYCSCQTISYGDMIACEGQNCRYQWFHFGCVNITKAPDTDWFCPDCRVKKRRKSSKRKSIGFAAKRRKYLRKKVA